MRCFIHMNDEAIAVCKNCGKAMCGNCSAYTNHSGICPECRREEFIRERQALQERLGGNMTSIVFAIIFAVAFAAIAIALAIASGVWGLVFLIGTLILGLIVLKLFFNRKPIKARINYLNTEINKLNNALKKGTAVI